MQIFDGKAFAKQKEQELTQVITNSLVIPKIISFIFVEDEGSRLYTRLKKQAAERVGIVFVAKEFSILDDHEKVISVIKEVSQDKAVTGVMVQKPTRKVFANYSKTDFNEWWQRLVSAIDVEKDIDCLHPINLQQVYNGNWQVLPATVKACVDILQHVMESENHTTEITPLPCYRQGLPLFQGERPLVCVIGQSEIVGKPLAAVLEQMGCKVVCADRSTKDLTDVTTNCDVIVSATGKKDLITESMVKEGFVGIDVGAPYTEINKKAAKKASFYTPVPGGVGPVTVVSLLENCVSKLDF